MYLSTSKICSVYGDSVDVMEPLFQSYGGRKEFYGQVVTIKCFEQVGVILDTLRQDGAGKVLIIDAGGSLRKAVLSEDIVSLATHNAWEGIICYGAVCDVKELADFDIGIKAVGAFPVIAEENDQGEQDCPVNFAGATIYSGDYVYTDETGIVLSQEPLDLNS